MRFFYKFYISVYKVFKTAAANYTSSMSTVKVGVVNTANGHNFTGGSTSFDSKGEAGTWTGNVDYQFARNHIYYHKQLIHLDIVYLEFIVVHTELR